VSPDGEWIAFRTTAPQEDLFVIHPDGTALRQLTDDAFRDRAPSWLPDGRIVFFSDRTGRYEAWAARTDGSGLEQLTATSGQPIYAPLAAPDGRRLVCNLGFTGLALIDLQAPLPRRVPVPVPGVAGSFFSSSWSRDGSRLALADYDNRILVHSFATGRSELLPVLGLDPAWMRDGRRLLFRRTGTIYVFDLGTRETRKVLDPPVGTSFSSFDVAPDERSLVLAHETREGDLWMLTMQADSH
jgi:Tol biopolymer transport system component